MQGAERAAILMLGMGEENAGEIMRHLDHKKVQKLGQVMARVQNISAERINECVRDFVNAAKQHTNLGVGQEDYIKNVLIKALGEDIAVGVIGRIFEGQNDIHGLDTLKWMDARTVAEIIRNEHPQVIAIVLTYLDSDQAAEVLSFLPGEMSVDLVLRMASLDAIEPSALQELNAIIQKQFAGNKNKARELGGAKKVANIMNSLDKSMEVKVMDGIRDFDEDLSARIQDLMFVFENLLSVDDRSMQVLLREVPSETLILALKTADEPMKDKVFNNMSKRAAEMLKDDLEVRGPARLRDVEAAQKEILAVARRLADEGEMVLGQGGEEMV